MNRVMEVRETMATLKRMIAACVMVLGAAVAASAQVSASEAERIHLRQQMERMELTLVQAVKHGADMVYAQFKAVFPDRPRFSEPTRVTGFTLPGYGPVFTIDVPVFQVPILYEVLMRDFQLRNATTELQRMKAQFNGMPPGPQRDRLAAAIFQLEQQLGLRPEGRDGLNADSLVPRVPAGITGFEPRDADDPMSAYSREVKAALIEAVLVNSGGLTIGADEWLTLFVRNVVTRDQQSPGDTVENSQGLIRVKGSVLAAFRTEKISKEEALKQVEVKQQ